MPLGVLNLKLNFQEVFFMNSGTIYIFTLFHFLGMHIGRNAQNYSIFYFTLKLIPDENGRMQLLDFFKFNGKQYSINYTYSEITLSKDFAFRANKLPSHSPENLMRPKFPKKSELFAFDLEIYWKQLRSRYKLYLFCNQIVQGFNIAFIAMVPNICRTIHQEIQYIQSGEKIVIFYI